MWRNRVWRYGRVGSGGLGGDWFGGLDFDAVGIRLAGAGFGRFV